jgi:hypothetical protein
MTAKMPGKPKAQMSIQAEMPNMRLRTAKPEVGGGFGGGYQPWGGPYGAPYGGCGGKDTQDLYLRDRRGVQSTFCTLISSLDSV